MTYTLQRLLDATSQTTAGGRLVLISGRDPLHTSGGSESYVVAHARAAILAGYTPHVFSIARHSEVRETDFGFLHRVGSPVAKPRSIYAVLQRPWLVPAVVRLLEGQSGLHVIHSFGGWADIVMRCAARLARRGVAVAPVGTMFVTHEHEATVKLTSTVVQASHLWRAVYRLELAWVHAITIAVERRACQSLPTIIVNYESVRADLEQRYGRLPIRRLTYTVPTAFADPPAKAPLPEPARTAGDPAAPLIVSVSRHDGRKGLEVLIAALAGLRRAGISFRACLVGPGLLLSQHRRLVRELGLEDQVSLPGRVREVMPYLMHADVYVLPSREEGSGSVAVLEAMQASAPIVASAVDGIPEDLTDGHDALLVAPGDAVALRQAIARLLSDAGLRRRLGDEARRTYERRFAPPVVARQLANLYTELGLPPSRPSRNPKSANSAAREMKPSPVTTR